MARSVSWLPRLHVITQAVNNSVRSHYGRRELELLFKLKPKTAGKLLELLATDRIGTSHLVSRDTLSAFLGRVREADDPAQVMEDLRQERVNLSRVKSRYLMPRDLPESSITSLPSAVCVEPGCLTIRFDTMEELLERLVMLGHVMNDDPLGFASQCERNLQEETPEQADAKYINSQIELMKTAAQTPGSQHT